MKLAPVPIVRKRKMFKIFILCNVVMKIHIVLNSKDDNNKHHVTQSNRQISAVHLC